MITDILKKCTIDGLVIKLPAGQLERDTYTQVKNKLELIGGKWKGGKTQGFVFQDDPTELLEDIANGEDRNLKKEYQFFATPPTVARMMMQSLPSITEGMKILEPSAGSGALLKSFFEYFPGLDITIDCFELMELNRKKLASVNGANIIGDDFIKSVDAEENDLFWWNKKKPDYSILNHYDIIIANPPFAKNQDAEHIQAMYKCLKPGGSLVSICSIGWMYATKGKGVEFRQWLDNQGQLSEQEFHTFAQIGTDTSFSTKNNGYVSIQMIDAGAFKDSGTNVRTAMIHINKPNIEKHTNTQHLLESWSAPPLGDPGPLARLLKDNYSKVGAGAIPKASQRIRSCRVCGCTENDCRQCVAKTGEPCHWVEQDLCSACVGETTAQCREETNPAGKTITTPSNKIKMAKEKNKPGIPIPALAPVSFKELPLSVIIPDTNQPRRYYNETAMQELIDSVRINGVLQPILVRPDGDKYKLVCGERRYRAAMAVNIAIKQRDSIPVMVRELTDAEALELQIIENLQRKDVQPMEEAVSFKSLVETNKKTIEEIAGRIGKSPNYVAQRIKLNDLIPGFQELLDGDKLSLTDAVKLCRFEPSIQKEAYRQADVPKDWQKKKGWELNGWFLRNLDNHKHELDSAPFKTNDATLYPEAGACNACPHNSHFNKLLFPELQKKRICHNGGCFSIKSAKAYQLRIREAMEDPEILFVSNCYYAGNEEKADIKLAEELGATVLPNDYFEKAAEPKEPEPWEQVLAEAKEDEEDWNDDYEHTCKEEYDEDVKAYQSGLEKYKLAKENGLIKKAFVVTGNSKGQYINITVKAKSWSAVAPAAGSQGIAGMVHIESELAAIQERRERNSEIDREKITKRTHETLAKEVQLKDSALLAEEFKILAFFFYDNCGYKTRDWFKKEIGCDSDDYKRLDLWECLKKKATPQLIFTFIRRALCDKLFSESESDYGRFGKAAVIYHMAELWIPEFLKLYLAEQNEKTKKREGNVQKRIDSFNSQKAELLETAKKETKASKKK
jgi:ParB family chromosome partitioning protein